MRKLWLALIILLLVQSGFESYAQINRKNIKKNNKRISSFRGARSAFSKDKIYTAFAFSVNALNYYGDLAPRPQRVSTDISFTKPGFGASLVHRFGPRYTLQAQFMYGWLKGSDAESADATDLSNGVYRYRRNLSFRNQIKELSVVGILDLFRNDGNYMSRARWTPYAFLGLSAFHHSPQAIAPAKDLKGANLPEAGQWVKLRPLGTEGQYSNLLPTDANYGSKPYSSFQVAIPFGFGVRIRITDVLDLWADLGFRYTFTDYLDDVSKNYVDLGVLKSDLARSMSYRTGELTLSSSTRSYVGRDNNVYTVEYGYGEEYVENMRGGKREKDIFMVTSIRLSYIVGATYHRAKFR